MYDAERASADARHERMSILKCENMTLTETQVE